MPAPRPDSSAQHKARAAPTKQLLVNVLTKDIDLIAAILDLVDNSVDAARRIVGALGSLKEYRVQLAVGPDSLTLTDNCGGISLQDAEKYAFRFGPDPEDPPDPFSTGQFGVGMKRALFKLGHAFHIESRAASDQFDLEFEVANWLRASEWDFPLKNVLTDQSLPATDRGTTITITPLKKAIAEELSRTRVLNDLKQQLAKRHQMSIARGLEIKVGRALLKTEEPKVVSDRRISPLVCHANINGADNPVSVGIVCGVSSGTQREGGWYVFLNERAVLLADQSPATGWVGGDDKDSKDTTRLPRYHGQYGRFRGFVFLSCEDTTRLPWNTTKTGLDADDRIYRQVLTMMIDAADPVTDFLDDVAREDKDQGARLGDVGLAIKEGNTASVFELAAGDDRAWQGPPVVVAPPPARDTVRVYTDQKETLVELAKEAASARSNRELGDTIFEYYVNREVID